MRHATHTSIGMLATIPFMFSLMGLAGFFFVGNLAVVVAERNEAEAAKTMLQQQEHEATTLDDTVQRILERIAALQAEIARLSAARHGPETLAALQRDLQALQAAFEKARKDHGQLQHQRATLTDKLATLQKLEKQVADMRLSETEIARQVKELQQEIAAITQQIGGVQRELDTKEQVQVKQLVPAGSRKPAVFVECNAEGVWLMPERTLLQATVPPAARNTFMARATAKGYVVFLIRPDGLAAFKRYREIVETHNKTAQVKLDMGYEPVNADWKLVYPKN